MHLICKRTSACQWKEIQALWTHLEVCAGQEIQKKSSSRVNFLFHDKSSFLIYLSNVYIKLVTSLTS